MKHSTVVTSAVCRITQTPCGEQFKAIIVDYGP
jgi:hypothetical protein